MLSHDEIHAELDDRVGCLSNDMADLEEQNKSLWSLLQRQKKELAEIKQLFLYLAQGRVIEISEDKKHINVRVSK
jgi:hypothetical protein